MGLGNGFLNKVAPYSRQRYKCVDDLNDSVVKGRVCRYETREKETETLKESIIDVWDNITNVHHFAQNTVDWRN